MQCAADDPKPVEPHILDETLQEVSEFEGRTITREEAIEVAGRGFSKYAAKRRRKKRD
jgi:hypothetical protein